MNGRVWQSYDIFLDHRSLRIRSNLKVEGEHRRFSFENGETYKHMAPL